MRKRIRVFTEEECLVLESHRPRDIPPKDWVGYWGKTFTWSPSNPKVVEKCERILREHRKTIA